MKVPFDEKIWTGRHDPHEPGDTRRIFDQVRAFEGQPLPAHASVIIGFASDEGVRRNQGRPGAAHGPKELRRALAGLPAKPARAVFDAGDVACDDADQESAQAQLARQVSEVLARGALPLIFGGGHEVAWATYCGLRAHVGDANTRRLLVVNFDAHFDLRQSRPGNSGTPFDQIACDCAARELPLRYACFGVSDLANTAALFERARQLGAHHALDTQMQDVHLPERLAELGQLLDEADDVYLSIDLDVLPGAAAPGVSAPAALGVPLSVVETMVRRVSASGKLRVADIAEYNPSLDEDRRTARAAARLAHRLL